MVQLPASQDMEPEPQDETLVFGDLTWRRLEEVLASHAGGPVNRMAVRHLLATAQSLAHSWSEDELCVEIVSIVAIALQRRPSACPQSFKPYGVEARTGASTMN